MEGYASLRNHVHNRAGNPWPAQRATSHLEPLRGVKKEAGDGPQYVELSEPCFDDPKERHHISPEAEAGGWIRDEPVDSHSGLQRSGSSGAFSSGNHGSLGNVAVEGKMYSGTKTTNFSVPPVSMSPPSDALPSGSPGRLPDLTEDAAGPPNQTSNPSVPQDQRANLYAQLRGIRIKENVIRSAIERLGGGQKGLRALIKVIMLYLRVKNGVTPSQASDQFGVQEPLAPVSLDEIEKLNWNQVGSLEYPFITSQENGSSCNGNGDMHFLMTSAFSDGAQGGVSGTGDLKLGDYIEARNHDKHMLSINEPGTLSGMIGDVGVQDLGVQGSMASLEVQPSLVAGWNQQSFISHERQHRVGIRRRSPSPERMSLSTDLGYEDVQFHRNKIRRPSPPGNSSTSSCEVPAYPSISQSVPDVMSYSNPFAPFSISPSSPSLDHHMEIGTFGSFVMQGTSLIEEAAMGCAAGMYPVDSAMEREQTGARLGLVGKNKATPAAHTRLARKNRMDRNRRSASVHSSRSAQSGGPSGGVTATGWLPPSTALRTPQSQILPVGEGQEAPTSTCSGQISSEVLQLLPAGQWPPRLRSYLLRCGGEIFESVGKFKRSQPEIFTKALAQEAYKEVEACSTQGNTGLKNSLQFALLKSKVRDRRDMDNVQYLLQKMLKPSDVGNLGRIVLPKKDAESHLPWLGAREGIAFPCEDFDTGDKLNLRYRFWPNNKSRMYLLENTGDFVKKHTLEEGDRLMIYKNIQDDSFIIRGRKAQDCVDLAANQAQTDDKESRGKEASSQGPPVSGSSSGTSSVDMDGGVSEAPLDNAVSGLEEEPASGITGVTLITSQDDLFADLPDAPMGDGTEPLVRFPSLEAFDELLGMVPTFLSQQQQESL